MVDYGVRFWPRVEFERKSAQRIAFSALSMTTDISYLDELIRNAAVSNTRVTRLFPPEPAAERCLGNS